MKFAVVATGAVVEGATVRHGSDMPARQWPWALFRVSIAAMLTPAGIAWIEFVLEEGNGFGVALLAALDTLDRAAGVRAAALHGLLCRMWGGHVLVDRAREEGVHSTTRMVGVRAWLLERLCGLCIWKRRAW